MKVTVGLCTLYGDPENPAVDLRAELTALGQASCGKASMREVMEKQRRLWLTSEESRTCGLLWGFQAIQVAPVSVLAST